MYGGGAGVEALRDPAQAEDAPFLLLALAALRHGELGVAALLREHSRSGDLRRRAAAAIAADRLGYTMLLHEMCAAEPDGELRRQIAARAAFGPSPDDGDDGRAQRAPRADAPLRRRRGRWWSLALQGSRVLAGSFRCSELARTLRNPNSKFGAKVRVVVRPKRRVKALGPPELRLRVMGPPTEEP